MLKCYRIINWDTFKWYFWLVFSNCPNMSPVCCNDRSVGVGILKIHLIKFSGEFCTKRSVTREDWTQLMTSQMVRRDSNPVVSEREPGSSSTAGEVFKCTKPFWPKRRPRSRRNRKLPILDRRRRRQRRRLRRHQGRRRPKPLLSSRVLGEIRPQFPWVTVRVTQLVFEVGLTCWWI